MSPERLGGHDESGDRDRAARHRGLQTVDIAAAGQDDAIGPDPAARGRDLPTALHDGKAGRGRHLEHLDSRLGASPRETAVQVQRMDGQRRRREERVAIARRRERLAQPGLGPVVVVNIEVTRREVPVGQEIVLGARDVAAERSRLQGTAIDAVGVDALAHQRQAEPREPLELPRPVEADAGASLSQPIGKASDAKPPLRPDAPQPMRRASINATLTPLRARSSAVLQPASPPPITATSTSRS